MGYQPLIFSGFVVGSSGGGGGGGVSSVGLALPGSVFLITGSPVTTSGTLTGSFINQSAKTFFSGPNGSNGTPTFRLILPSDLPSISLTSGVNSVLPIANGGTNSGSALSNNKVIVSSGGSIIESATTTTQLSFLDATSSIQTQLNAKQGSLGYTAENTANKGIANGYAGLDGSGKVPYAQLPSALMTFRGAWNPTTNTPTLTNGTGLAGDTYRASVNGSSSAPIVDTWYAGDFIIYNGSIWQRSPLADGVISVNGLVGAVTLTQGNLTDAGTDGIIITGGTNAVWGSGTSIAQQVADATHNGYLASTDFNTFTTKQPAGSYITALTGDVTASGPGSAIASISSTTVTSKLLTGFVSGPNSPVLATDSILQGLQKLQAQVSATGAGTVTSVALSVPAALLTVTGSPITTNGTLAVSLASQSANTVFAAPNGSSGTPSFRTLVAADTGSPGDISETSFTAADNQASAANITGFAFANGIVRSFDSLVSIVRNNTYSSYKLNAIQKAASWELTQNFVGDTTGIIFSITAAGQLQYTSTSTGFTALIKFRAVTTSV
jgi:hypothetical protein